MSVNHLLPPGASLRGRVGKGEGRVQVSRLFFFPYIFSYFFITVCIQCYSALVQMYSTWLDSHVLHRVVSPCFKSPPGTTHSCRDIVVSLDTIYIYPHLSMSKSYMFIRVSVKAPTS